MLRKIFNFLDRYTDGPARWPQRWRRAYLLTLPISFPLFFLSVIPALAVALIVLVFIGASDASGNWVRRMWG